MLFTLTSVMAQSQLVPPERMGQEDRRDDNLNGKCGVLIISRIPNLLINVVNDKTAIVDSRSKNKDGNYEYLIIVDRDQTPNPQLEISKFADVNSVKFVAKTRKNYIHAYMLEEVERPIRHETQTQGTVLNASLSEIEFTTALTDLKVECNPALEAKISVSKRAGDTNVNIITVTIPVANKESIIQSYTQKIDRKRARFNTLKANYEKISDTEAKECDELEEEIASDSEELDNIFTISVSAPGTNILTFNIKDAISPRIKTRYGVLALQTVVREHVSKCMAIMEEAGKFFTNRKYEDAKRSFTTALSAEDTPAELVPVIQSNISRCDTCILYEQLTKNALKRIVDIKKEGAVSQNDIMEYYGAAVEFMKVAERYNPCEYYAKTINTLETYMENMPIIMKFTIARWISDRVSVYEDGVFPNVQLWAYYGTTQPRINDYSNDRKFRKMMGNASWLYKQMGTSDEKGEIEMNFSRKETPTGFFFRPAVADDKVKIVYKDMQDIMRQSKGMYNKRQFRMRMYIDK